MSNRLGEFWLDNNLQTSLTTDQCENKKEKRNNNRLGITVGICILLLTNEAGKNGAEISKRESWQVLGPPF